MGYAIVDEKTGRIDVHDVNTNRTGYGKISQSVNLDSTSTSAVEPAAPSSKTSFACPEVFLCFFGFGIGVMN